MSKGVGPQYSEGTARGSGVSSLLCLALFLLRDILPGELLLGLLLCMLCLRLMTTGEPGVQLSGMMMLAEGPFSASLKLRPPASG